MNEFVAQIVAAPDDDRPRLVYADHLMERGDPQGELIAVQCALARHDATDDNLEASATVPQPLDALEIETVSASVAAARGVLTDALVACEARACLSSLGLSSVGAGLADLHRLPLRTLALRDATVPDGALYSIARRCPLEVLDLARTRDTKERSTLDVASIVNAAPALRRQIG